MKEYTFVPVLSGGQPLPEVKVQATDQKIAHAMVWNTLTEDQKNNLEYLDWVDTREVA